MAIILRLELVLLGGFGVLKILLMVSSLHLGCKNSDCPSCDLKASIHKEHSQTPALLSRSCSNPACIYVKTCILDFWVNV